MKHSKFLRATIAITMMLIGWLPSLAYDFYVGHIYYNKTSENTVAVAGSTDSHTVIPSSVYYDHDRVTYSVTSIGYCAFESNTFLKSIEIPNSVTLIESSAFSFCTGLKSIEIPNSVTSIGSSAFYGCTGLKSIEIPNSVTSIGQYAFYGCTGLTSIEIPNSVTSIGDYAFVGCSRLTSIQIPNSVTSIGEGAFGDCSSLTSVVWNAKKCSDFTYFDDGLFKDSKNITSFTFGDSVEHIPAYLCSRMSSLTSIKISNSVTSIGEWAFRGCTGLKSIEIPNGVTSIGQYAFSGCTGLTSIEIPNSVTLIESGAFSDCTGLKSIEIPNSVTSIGVWAFDGCTGLTNITVDENNTKYDSRNGCNAIIETASNTLIVGCQNTIIPNSVTSIGEYAFDDCTGLKSIEIPNSVTSIGQYAFDGCTGLKSIEIPNSVTSIGSSAFYGCSSLTSVVWNAKKCSDFTSSENSPFKNSTNITSFTFGDSVEHIPAYLCYGMSGLTNLEIPNSTTSIGESAFYNGEKLTILVLGNSVILIEKDAFKGCDNIKKIDSKATKAPAIENEDQFSENVYAKADLFVPTGYEDNYKYAYAWSEFYNIKGKDFTGIENVSLATLFITVDVNNIIVYNAPTGSQVATYRIDGQMVALKTVTNNRTNIEVPNKGIYVVAIDGKSFKVMVK